MSRRKPWLSVYMGVAVSRTASYWQISHTPSIPPTTSASLTLYASSEPSLHLTDATGLFVPWTYSTAAAPTALDPSVKTLILFLLIFSCRRADFAILHYGGIQHWWCHRYKRNGLHFILYSVIWCWMLVRWLLCGDLCMFFSSSEAGFELGRVLSLTIDRWQIFFSVNSIGNIPACASRRSLGVDLKAPFIAKVVMRCTFDSWASVATDPVSSFLLVRGYIPYSMDCMRGVKVCVSFLLLHNLLYHGEGDVYV